MRVAWLVIVAALCAAQRPPGMPTQPADQPRELSYRSRSWGLRIIAVALSGLFGVVSISLILVFRDDAVVAFSSDPSSEQIAISDVIPIFVAIFILAITLVDPRKLLLAIKGASDLRSFWQTVVVCALVIGFSLSLRFVSYSDLPWANTALAVISLISVSWTVLSRPNLEHAISAPGRPAELAGPATNQNWK